MGRRGRCCWCALGEVALLGTLALAIRPAMPAGVRDAAPLLAIGVLDFSATAFFARARRKGSSALFRVGSLYPAVTVVLARMLLAERVSRSQEVGGR